MFRQHAVTAASSRRRGSLFALLLGGLTAVGFLPETARAITVPPGFSCSFIVSDIDFGDVIPFSASPTTTHGVIEIRCSRGFRYGWVTICPSIGYGDGNPSAWNPRQMARTGAFARKLNYQLYHPGTATIWGSFYWNRPPKPPVLHYRLSSRGSGVWRVNIDALVFSGQTTVVPGNYVSNFSGGDVRFAYLSGYASDCRYPYRVESPSFQVRARVPDFCEVSATDLDFGTVGLLQNPVDANGSIRVRCTNGTTYRIRLSGGQAGAVAPDQRRMRRGSHTVRYGIFRDSARTLGWGDQPGNSVSGVGNGAVQTYTTHGRVFAQPTPPAGTYTDTIVVTVDY